MDIKQCDCKMSCTIAPNLLPRESFQALGQGGGTQAKPDSLPKLGRRSWKSREPCRARVHRAKYQKGESYTKRELQKFPEGPPQVSADYS